MKALRKSGMGPGPKNGRTVGIDRPDAQRAGRANNPRRGAARPFASALLFAAATVAASPAAAFAQDDGPQWFPGGQRFAPLLADPHEVRLGAGLGWTDVFDPDNPHVERPAFAFPDPDDMERDLQGIVALGGTIPLWGSSDEADRGVMVGAQAVVFARFRIEEPSRDYAASDWMVALPVEWADGPTSARARILHRSSHLGDEIIVDTGARRIEYGHEAVDVIVARRIRPELRIYGGGAWIFRSNTENEPLLVFRGVDVRDDFALQAGFDAELRPWDDPRLSLLAGLDWQSAQRTEWRPQFAAAAGLGTRGTGGGLRLLLRLIHGPSVAGEFFLTDETLWLLEATVTP